LVIASTRLLGLITSGAVGVELAIVAIRAPMPILGLTWARPRDLDSKVSTQFDYVASP
jgi:hypothetical protein